MTKRVGTAELLAAALDLVLPQECAGCTAPGRPWCVACEVAVRGVPLQVASALPCRAAAVHSGPAGRAVVAFKEAGVRPLAGPLSRLLAGAVLQVADDVQPGWAGPVWLVPVPTRRSARRRRGTDPVSVLAGRAARALRAAGVPANRCRALSCVVDGPDQVGLSAAGRRANLARTMRSGPVPPGVVVLVDDVATTGTTLAEAARALREGPSSPPVGRLAAATVTWSRLAAAPRVAGRGGLAL